MNFLRINLLFGILLLLVTGCQKEEQIQLEDPYMKTYADVSECLSFTPLKGNQPGPGQSCILYNYDGDSILSITHYNSGFNCCPEAILTSFEIRNDTIFIVENDSVELCRCNCLFNVEMTIHNIAPGNYVLKIEEPYVNQKDQIFIINLDLENLPMDQVCKNRDFYPWH